MRKLFGLLPSAQLAHDLAPIALATKGIISKPKKLVWQSKEWRDLKFENPLGVAGGVDKNAVGIKGLWSLGPGFVEIGTVTPRAQKRNPGISVLRNEEKAALWNQLGFPSQGALNVAARVRSLKNKIPSPLFVNVGKNRETSLDNAAADYILAMQPFDGLADVFVANISSPNTKQLRDIHSPERLAPFLKAIQLAARKIKNRNQLEGVPVLLKLSPDLEPELLKQVLEVSFDQDIAGWICGNSSNTLNSAAEFPEHGGVSGKPLKNLAERSLMTITDFLKTKTHNRLVVSCGGVMTPSDVFDRLRGGAHLVQVYSALVLEGPNFFKDVFAQTLEGASSGE